MKRKLFCTLAALLLLISVLCVPAAAEETENFVFDMAGILSADDVTALNLAFAALSEEEQNAILSDYSKLPKADNYAILLGECSSEQKARAMRRMLTGSSPTCGLRGSGMNHQP